MLEIHSEKTSEKFKITSVTAKSLAEVIHKSGSREVSQKTIQADIDAGAPVKSDGTINMIEYAAWLVREMISGD